MAACQVVLQLSRDAVGYGSAWRSFCRSPGGVPGFLLLLGVLHPEGLKAVAQHPEGGQPSRTGLCSCPASPRMIALHGSILSREGRRAREQTDHQKKPRLTIRTPHSATRQHWSWGSTGRSRDTVKDQVNLKEKPFEFELLGSFPHARVILGVIPRPGGRQLLSLGLSHLWHTWGGGSPRAAQRSQDDSLDQEPSAPGENTEQTRAHFHLLQLIMPKINHVCKPSPCLYL